MPQNTVKAFPLSTLNSAAMLAAYQPLNVTEFSNPASLIKIVNASNQAITISYDGIIDNEYLPAGYTFELPAALIAQPKSNLALVPAHSHVYVKGTAGVGIIALSGYYL